MRRNPSATALPRHGVSVRPRPVSSIGPCTVRGASAIVCALVFWNTGLRHTRAGEPVAEDFPGGFLEETAARHAGSGAKLGPSGTRIQIKRTFRLPGEFEPQNALLLGSSEMLATAPRLFVDIIRHTEGKVPVVALVGNAEEFQQAKALLAQQRIAGGHVHFAEVAQDTMWIRDYGPMILESERGAVMLDAGYDQSRAKDDRVPVELARLLGMQRIAVPFIIEGGNVLSNGAGLAIMSDQIHDPSIISVNDEAVMFNALQRLYGFQQLVTLEALAGEPTGHVDMFATFIAEDTVLIGAYSREDDPVNAAILDRNAALLSGIPTRSGHLRVVRIPMPRNSDGIWRTYTNVVYANGTVLVPIYPEIDERGRQFALGTYAALLPGWKVIAIDVSPIIESSGALHCITMNLGPIGPLPKLPAPRHAPKFRLPGGQIVTAALTGPSRMHSPFQALPAFLGAGSSSADDIALSN